MPTKPIYRKGKLIGYRWGSSGKLYSIDHYGKIIAKSLANKQGQAIHASGWQNPRKRNHSSSPKKRRWIKRRDGHRQRYWTGKKPKSRSRRRVSKLFRLQLEDKGIKIHGSLGHQKGLQRFFRKYPEEIDVLQTDDKIQGTTIYPSLDTKSLGRFRLMSHPFHQRLKSEIDFDQDLLFQKEVKGASFQDVIKHEIGHLKDYRKNPEAFSRQSKKEKKAQAEHKRIAKDEFEYLSLLKSHTSPSWVKESFMDSSQQKKLEKVYRQYPSEVYADRYARKIPQRKMAQFQGAKIRGEKRFREVFK